MSTPGDRRGSGQKAGIEQEKDRALAELRRANAELEALVSQRSAALAASQRRYRRIFERSKDIIIVSSPDGRLIDINPAGLDLYEYSSLESMLAIDLKNEMWADPAARDAYVRQLRQLGYVKDFEAQHKTRTGRVFTVTGTTSTVNDADGNIVEMLTICRDISEQKRLLSELERLARTDSLTGLANRAVFREQLERALARSHRQSTGFAVIMLDLDHLKEINDSFGHPAGDTVLVAAAERFRDNLREIDVLARHGGDEFALLLTDIESEAQAVETANRLVSCLESPIVIEGREIRASVSVGIAMPTEQDRDPDQLLQRADRALYRAKGRGRNQFSL